MLSAAIVLSGGLLVSALATTVSVSAVSSARDDPSRVYLAEVLPCTERNATPNFRTYGLGGSIGEIKLVEALRRCDLPYPGEPVAANYVSYIYGDCELQIVEGKRTSCQPKLEIQSWPSCQRSLSDYESSLLDLEVSRLADVGNASQFEIGHERIEIYTDNTTIVFFSPDPKLLRSAAQKVAEQSYVSSLKWLRVEDTDRSEQGGELVTFDGELQSPDEGALEGRLECS